ncbi:hypothetical protein CK203_107145 [Vitis vinifera]|uniref:Uncharacterized protein n=1 Tax=Vitis vinifera TaxID=29760 RepID=A0A438CVL6_VITVI|nr:hypothetical protein CK203_107145 [Vitis vinifera]
MTTRGVPVPASILFTIDGRQEDHFQEGASPGMLLVDVVLRTNLFPLQHKRRCKAASYEGGSIQLLFPRLLCHVLAHMGFPADPQLSPAAIVERASLLTMESVWLHQHSPELPEPREVPPAPSTSAPSEPVPEAASSDAPPAVPPTSEPPITIPGQSTVPCSLLSDSDHYSDGHYGAMDHFQIQQDQQTLILREIQQHLGLVHQLHL